MYTFIACILLIFTITVSGQQESKPKLHIGLYYGSFCEDSINFITNQLAIAYEYIRSYVDISYVPFGNSESVNGGEDFFCEHGISECETNKIQSCALFLLNQNQELQTKFVTCQMRMESDKTGRHCSEIVGINFTYVLSCYISKLGTALQLEAEILTNAVHNNITKFRSPTIAYNYVFRQDLEDRSKYDFLSVVCEQLSLHGGTILPIICTDSSFPFADISMKSKSCLTHNLK